MVIKLLFAAALIAHCAASSAASGNLMDFNFDTGNPNPTGPKGQTTGPLNGLGCNGNCPEITTEQVRAGDRAMKVYLNRLTSEVSYRTEATLNSGLTFDTGGENPQDYWIGFSVYFKGPWTVETAPNPTTSFFNFHGSPPPELGWGSGWCNNSNPLVVAVKPTTNTTGGIKVSIGGGGETGFCVGVPYNLKFAYVGTPVTYTVDEWIDVVIHVKWSPIAPNGFYRMWVNGTLVVDVTGALYHTGDPEPGPVYPKMGYYTGWKDRAMDEPVFERTLYFDEYKIDWGAEAGYDTVAPGGGTSPPDPETPTKLPPMTNLRIVAPN